MLSVECWGVVGIFFMAENYWRGFGLVQVFIFAACLTIYFSAGRDWKLAGVIFLVMELGAIFSATLGARVRGRGRKRGKELPLRRR
jgi:hypothetical protein